ncbi:substrate-binding domain-containing protein [Halomonas sp. ANAO-440]|uniref:LacI family DNA-binding transcriptional regulator n=1 Tax=Halomonas sp. ANAO-440 TaxID=2861360 RepID=UPI001CAA435D|nr:substrate-binding domain-containing protein [Halomonas sp. ANAO-440]MBZ0332243.1 substrate-binding domain-containing protein [Halomonas sp. ANAO-440]
MTQSHRATIIEVARAASTSKTSVSRYFGEERERLSPPLQARIAEAASHLGYHPNQMARGLKGGSSRLIGMLVADIRNPFSVAVMHGVEQACREQGLSLLVCNTDNDPAQEREHLALLTAYRIEGLVVNVAGSPHRELQNLAAQGVPMVLLDRELVDVDAELVGLDNPLAIDMALDHLQAQGYRELLYVSEPPGQASPRTTRLGCYQRGCEARSLTGKVHYQDLADTAMLHQVIAAFLTGSTRSPKALLCANGNVTLAVTRILHTLGARLGETGLIGIDELDWCALVGPGISTLAQPTDAIGRDAVQCLLAPGNRRVAPRGLHAPTLIARGSTRRPAQAPAQEEEPEQ